MKLWTPQHQKWAADLREAVGSQVFGKHPDAETAFRLINEGLKISVLDNFLKLFPKTKMAVGPVLGLSNRSLARRHQQGRFTPAESDRLFRLVKTYDLAARYGTSAPHRSWRLHLNDSRLTKTRCTVRHNLLLNPHHPDWKRVTIGSPERLLFDSRLS